MTTYLQVSETEKQLGEERSAGETAQAEAQSLKADLGAVRDSLAAASQQLASERDASACTPSLHQLCFLLLPPPVPPSSIAALECAGSASAVL